MGRPKKLKDPVRVPVLMERKFLEHLHRQAMHMSSVKGKQLSICEVVRIGLETAFPIPKQIKF